MGIRIVLIDDEREFTSALAERLRLRGYDVMVRDDGDSGVECVRNNTFDVAVLDLMMPGMNGLEALGHIRSCCPTLPVILLTGHGSARDGIEGMRIGAADYLMKPLDIEDLLVKINTAINEGKKDGK